MPHLPAAAAPHEPERLEALRRYDILDTAREEAFDDLTRLAAFICGTPISTVTFIDEHRQWFKSHRGLDDDETPREQAFCAHAILDNGVFVVSDARLDERFSDNPLVTGAPHIRFYAGAPLVTPEGFALGTICVIDREPRTLSHEQTEALQALSRRAMAQLEMRKTLGDLYVAYRELQSLDRARGDFVSLVSHQLRTPLASISASLQLALTADRAPLGADGVGQSLRDALAISERLTCLTNDVLDLSSMETGTLSLRRSICDVHDLVTAACAAPALVPLGRDRLHALVDEDAGLIDADADRIVEALVNLLAHALRSSPAATLVTTSARNIDDGVELTVRAAGPGLSPNDLARLFQPFARTDPARGAGGGLGLTIAKATIEQHGGTVKVASEVGDGITFKVTLPRK